MSSPEKYSPPPRTLPDYIVPFDEHHPSPDYKEQLEATGVLRGAVEDKLLDTMHGMTPAAKNADVFSRTSLDSFDFNGDYVEIYIDAADTTAYPDLPQYCVTLYEGPRCLDGTFMHAHYYNIPGQYSDEEVTRRDVSLSGAVSIDTSKMKPATDDSPPLTINPDSIDRLLDVFSEAGKNQQLEKEMGINDQPIGLREARSIALIVTRGTLRLPPLKTSK